ncbi:MAG: prealbumin-like fold domain-containing protein, partial [Ruminococcus sp.]|nr:prealbumin-like fold domain-containing protein [Ruminococcus sp.]
IDTDSNKKLNGATFRLYSSKDELIYPVGDNETFKIENGEIDLFNLLRENSEKCNPDYVQKGYLKVGSYYLKEVTPPADYEIQGDGKFGFIVKNDYSIEAVAAGTSNYISADINSTESSKQIWVYPIDSNKEKISVSNVTKIEIELNSPQSGTIVVYECNPLNEKTASIVDGIATFDNLSNISFDKMKLQNTSYDSGLDVKEIRIYGEKGSGSGSSSDSAYNIEQIAWNDDKSHNSTIELTFYYSDKEPQTKTVNVSGDTWWYKFDIDGNLNKENVVGIKINSKDSEWGKIKIKANDDKDVFGTDQDKWIGPGETLFGDTSGNFNSSTDETPEEPTKPAEGENLAVNVTEDGIIQI